MGRSQVVGATVADGSGRDPRDVAVEDGRITGLGAHGAHGERLGADGSTMTPGLIDAHVHLELSGLVQPQFSFQISTAEIAADIFATAGAALDPGFTTVRDTGGIDGGVVTVQAHDEGIRNAVEAGARCVEHGTDLDGPTAALMADRGVALVPTFAVVERLLHDPAAAGLGEPVRDRVAGVRERMAGALAVAKQAGVRIGWAPTSSSRPRTAAARNSRCAHSSRHRWKFSWRPRRPTPITGLTEVGVIAPGKQADLVLRNGNPLEDPNIFADPANAVLVVQAGRVVKDLR